jgi:AraC-like DNA-binding protein
MVILTISENFLLFFSAFGVLQGVLLAFLLYFHPKGDKSVNLFLSLYIFFIAVPSITLVGQYFFSWHVIIFVQPFLLLIGPLLYFYVRSFKEAITWRKAWPHFILPVVFVFLMYALYMETAYKYPAAKSVPKEVPLHPLYYIPLAIRSAQRILYYFLSYRVLVSYQHSIQQLYSETSRIDLQWVKWLINGYLALVLLIISFNLLTLKFPEYYNIWVLIIGTLVTIYIYLASVKGFSQVTLWQIYSGRDKRMLEQEIQQAEKTEKKALTAIKNSPQKAAFANEKINEINSKVTAIIKKQKLYAEPELTLSQLSDALQIPSYLVSQAINEGMKKSFYELINGYRVEEAKRMLLHPDNRNFTILSVGFEAGFNSKTTFNTVFKKFTGLTPTEYRDKQGINS